MNEWEYNQVCCLFKVKEAFRAGYREGISLRIILQLG